MSALQPPAFTAPYIDKLYCGGAAGPDAFDCYRLAAVASNETFNTHIDLYSDQVPDESRGRTVFREESAKLLDLRSNGGWREIAQPVVGDFILLRVGPHHCHCGLVVATAPRPVGAPPAGLMMHIHPGINVTNVEWHSSEWARRVVGFHRWSGGASDAR
ncbi:MAG: hypothetical protein HQ494_08915 [Rhodospirillales bacterium]|nr:hypothetical protein [Rhodospirillales bacterium]